MKKCVFNKNLKFKKKVADNHVFNILRHLDLLPTFPFTTSEIMGNYYSKHGTYELPHELPNKLKPLKGLYILENDKLGPRLPAKIKILLILTK